MLRAFGFACFLTGLWVNLVGATRAYFFTLPALREALAPLPNVALLNSTTLWAWNIWQGVYVVTVVLTFYLFAERWGYGRLQAVLAGTLIWVSFYVLYWFSLINLNVIHVTLVLWLLPLEWLEASSACLVALFAFRRAAPTVIVGPPDQ